MSFRGNPVCHYTVAWERCEGAKHAHLMLECRNLFVERHDVSRRQRMHGETRDRQARDVRFFDRKPRVAQLVEGRFGDQLQPGLLEILEQVSQRDVLGCREHGAPLLPRGGGTSQCGQCVNVAVVLDFSKYLGEVVSVDPVARTALVQPGAVCDALKAAAEAHGLTFGPDPATHSRCTLGGMIGNNSCGAHSVMAGKTVENVEALEVLTYDGARFWAGPTSADELEMIIARGGRQGEIYAKLKGLRDKYADLIRARFPKIKRRVSGYNLDQLLPENGFNVARALVGTEGTCAVTLQAVTRLVRNPAARVLLILGFPDIYAAGDVVPEVLRASPIACEGLDEKIIGGLRERRLKLEDIGLLPAGAAWLMIEFGAETREAAVAQARGLMAAVTGRDPQPSAWLIEVIGPEQRKDHLTG